MSENKNNQTEPKKKERASTKRKKVKFLEALKRNAGLISYACKSAKVSRWFYDAHMTGDPIFKAKVEQIQDELLDLAEAELFKHIKTGDKTMIMFYLNGPGKKRGYGNQPAPSAPSDQPQRVFNINVKQAKVSNG